MWIQDLRETCEKGFDNREAGQAEVSRLRENGRSHILWEKLETLYLRDSKDELRYFYRQMTQSGGFCWITKILERLDGEVRWSSEMIFWLVLFLGLGIFSIYLSRLQPFPERGTRFGWSVLISGLILWISSTSPQGSGQDLPASISVFLGGIFVMTGIRDMSMNKTDVIVAPLAGVLFCLGGLVFFLLDGSLQGSQNRLGLSFWQARWFRLKCI